MLRLATKISPSKKAVDIAATPYAVVVPMVLDRIDDHRAALRIALRNNRVLVAKALLADIYNTEYAIRVRIDKLDGSPWGIRLRELMDATAAMVEAEIKRFPDEVGHVLGVAPATRLSIARWPPDLPRLEGPRRDHRRRGLLHEADQRRLTIRAAGKSAPPARQLERDGIGLDHHRALASCLSMIFRKTATHFSGSCSSVA